MRFWDYYNNIYNAFLVFSVLLTKGDLFMNGFLSLFVNNQILSQYCLLSYTNFEREGVYYFDNFWAKIVTDNEVTLQVSKTTKEPNSDNDNYRNC